MDTKFRLRERLVGLFLVVTLVLSVGGVILVGRGKNWFATHYSYYTTFKEGYGLKEGSTVKMFNAEIGRVRAVTINDDNEVEVKMAILADYEKKLRLDSVATVESPTLIGSEYISITPGAKDKSLIPRGGRITSTPKKSISNYMDQLGLQEKFAQIGRLLTTLTHVTDDLSVVMANVKEVSAGVKAGQGSLGKLLTKDDLYVKVDSLASEMEQTATNLKELTASMKPAASEMPGLARDLGQSAKDLRTTVQNFKRGAEDFPALVTNTDEAVRQFRRVVESAKTLPLLNKSLPPDTRRDAVGLDPRAM
jgi:phospholipid/cholesterol/gamma-HCH transport system substrate-binding protein